MQGALTRLAAMPGRSRTRLLGLAAALTLAAAVAGCGGDEGGEKIPAEDAQAMLDTASRIEQASASQECDEAQSGTTELRGRVEALPEETDQEIVDALDQMVSRVDEQLDAECADTGTSEPEETTETVAPPTTTSPPTETTTTTTEPPEEDDEEEAPVQPPGEGGGGQGPPVSPPGQSGGEPPSGGTEEEG